MYITLFIFLNRQPDKWAGGGPHQGPGRLPGDPGAGRQLPLLRPRGRPLEPRPPREAGSEQEQHHQHPQHGLPDGAPGPRLPPPGGQPARQDTHAGNRREIITVRGLCLSSSKILTPHPLLRPVSVYHRVHRVVTAAFWRTFHHEGKIRPGWRGWGVHAHPLSLNLPSPVKLQCTLKLSGQTLFHLYPYMYSVVCTPRLAPAFVAGVGHTRRVERGVGGQYFGRCRTQLCTLPISNSLCWESMSLWRMTMQILCRLPPPWFWTVVDLQITRETVVFPLDRFRDHQLIDNLGWELSWIRRKPFHSAKIEVRACTFFLGAGQWSCSKA